MILDDLMRKSGLSRYRLAVIAGIPHATLNDICSGKTKLERCSAETVYKLAKTLGVSMEQLTESGIRETQREHSYEYSLPDYLQHDLDAYKEGLKTHSPLLEAVFIKQGAPNDTHVCLQARRFSAAILTDCKGKQRWMQANRPVRRCAMLMKTAS